MSSKTQEYQQIREEILKYFNDYDNHGSANARQELKRILDELRKGIGLRRKSERLRNQFSWLEEELASSN